MLHIIIMSVCLVCVLWSRAPYHGVRASMILIAIYLEKGMYKDLTQHCIRMTAEVGGASRFKWVGLLGLRGCGF